MVGHLVDSAANNHQRFVRLQLERELEFPAYDGDAWLRASKADSCDYRLLVRLWTEYNGYLLHIAERMDVITSYSIHYTKLYDWMDGRAGHEDQHCNQPGGLKPYSDCHVTKANFPTVAINLYNYNEVADTGVLGPRVHPRNNFV